MAAGPAAVVVVEEEVASQPLRPQMKRRARKIQPSEVFSFRFLLKVHRSSTAVENLPPPPALCQAAYFTARRTKPVRPAEVPVLWVRTDARTDGEGDDEDRSGRGVVMPFRRPPPQDD